MAWIELARKTVFGKTLACSASDALRLTGHTVVHDKGLTTVFNHGVPVITTDGLACLTIDGLRFEAERKWLQLRGLRANGCVLGFDWSPKGEGGYRRVRVRDSSDAGTSFIVKHDERLGFNLKTRVRIETAQTRVDTALMLGCLVFFWTLFENDRVSYA
ncbi:MAG TPA: hypothetical protein VFP68_09920 [Burkholderiaceae bacterium]|nr:hypothetical protein [Burkholderiaceae bacterium]